MAVEPFGPGVDVLATSPTVPYHLLLANGTQVPTTKPKAGFNFVKLA